MAELGIGYPVIVQRTPVTKVKVSMTQAVTGLGDAPGRLTADGQPEEEQFLQLKQYAFVLQFAWQPRSPGSLRRPAEQLPPDAVDTP